ncbi:MAG TPA: glycosyltransferase, partial [Candidatus Angelobacter sp.]
MKVLITNAYLDVYAGTQVVVKDLALELRRQGHQPMVYSPKVGAVGESLTRSGIQVTDKLNNLAAVPDIIHGQHYPAIEALLRFPSTPAIYVCHSAMPGYTETLCYFPRILRYVAVDEVCRKRVAAAPGIPPDRIQVSLNAVDLARFQPRIPLPSRPKRALVFSNNAARSSYLPAVRRACRRAGLEVHVAGLLSGNSVPNPENLLPRYDIVFAKARCALEAMAVGNAVVLCDFKGLGPMVSTKNFDGLRPMNFGSSATVNPIRADLIQKQIELYDSQDAAALCRRVRQEAGLEPAVRRWIQLYSDVIEEFRQMRRNPDEELQALALYLNQWNYARRVEWELE